MNKALATLQLLEQAVHLDQGAAFRSHLKNEVANAHDAYRTDSSPHRYHLGASIIGRECPREIWYSFRWATRKRHTGRLLRLFNRGHLEEARCIALLKAAGLQVWQHDQQGNQFRITAAGGHFGGSLDCVIQGIPEMPDVPVVGEFKTHNDKSFAKLVETGVQAAKWEHLIQTQIYMGRMNLQFALYLATNKNTDELYAEIIPFAQETHTRYMNRAYGIIAAAEPPVRVNESPTWFVCRMCDHLGVCHKQLLPDRTCRSCINSYPHDGGVWICKAKSCTPDAPTRLHPLSEEDQLAACEQYNVIPTF